jgi:hypothetical protein
MNCIFCENKALTIYQIEKCLRDEQIEVTDPEKQIRQCIYHIKKNINNRLESDVADLILSSNLYGGYFIGKNVAILGQK